MSTRSVAIHPAVPAISAPVRALRLIPGILLLVAVGYSGKLIE